MFFSLCKFEVFSCNNDKGGEAFFKPEISTLGGSVLLQGACTSPWLSLPSVLLSFTQLRTSGKRIQDNHLYISKFRVLDGSILCGLGLKFFKLSGLEIRLKQQKKTKKNLYYRPQTEICFNACVTLHLNISVHKYHISHLQQK